MTIEECLTQAERVLAEQRRLGGNPLWSPRLIEAVRFVVDNITSEPCWEYFHENIERILNG